MSPEDTTVPFPIYKCESCGHINKGFNPFEEHSLAVQPMGKSQDVYLLDMAKSLEENLLNCEKCIIEKSLGVFKKKQEVADHLGIDRRTLSRKLNFFGLK